MLKRYREYTIYLIKAVSSSCIIYLCFYTLCLILFGIHLPPVMFFSGAALILCSQLSMHYNKNRSFLKGAAFSLIIAAILYLSGNTPAVIIISFIFNLLMWRVGKNLYNSGIQYELYREQFITGFRILIAVILILALNGDRSTIISRYPLIYLILEFLLLRNSRELQCVGLKKGNKAGLVNLISNLFIIIMLLLITWDSFLHSIFLFLRAAWNIFGILIEKIVYAVGMVIGLILTPLINFLKHNIHLKGNIDIKNNNQNVHILNPPASINIPPVVYLILKIITIALSAAIILRIYKSHSKKKKDRDYSEETEFIFNINEVSSSINKNLSAAFKKVKKIFSKKPATVRDRIRYIYSEFLKLSIKKRIYTKISETPEEIRTNAEKYVKEGLEIKLLTDTYEKARYSNRSISETDLENARTGYQKIRHI